MSIPQISIFLENRPGKLAEVIDSLGKAGIDLRALSLADTADFGIVRLITDQPEHAQEVLRAQGFVVKVNPVLAVVMEHQPGALSNILHVIAQADISIEYLYAFAGGVAGKAVVVLRLNKPEAGEEVLTRAGLTLLSPQDIPGL